MGKNSWSMAYTRQNYISSRPQSRINKFTSGDTHDQYEYAVSLTASTNVEIHSRALEAARVTANRVLERALGEQAFLLQIVPYPHQVVREHKFMGFAGADRLSQGMKLSFGRPTGRAARVSKGQNILTIFINEDELAAAKKALERASKKLPVKYNIDVEKVVDDEGEVK